MLETTMKIWADNFIAQGKEEDAINMLQDGLSVEKVCQYTGLPADTVENLAKKHAGKACEGATPYKATKKRKTSPKSSK